MGSSVLGEVLLRDLLRDLDLLSLLMLLDEPVTSGFCAVELLPDLLRDLLRDLVLPLLNMPKEICTTGALNVNLFSL